MTVTRINPETLYDAVEYGFSHASLQDSGRTLHLAGQVAWDKDRALVGEGDLTLQTQQALGNLNAVLSAVGACPSDIVRLRTYVVDHSPEKLGPILAEIGNFFGENTPPPNTFIGVQALALPDFLIEIEATATLP